MTTAGPESVRFEPPPDSAINAALQRVDYRLLKADCGQPAIRKDKADVYVDVSAYAKGFGVDRVAELLDVRGLHRYLVEIGGFVLAESEGIPAYFQLRTAGGFGQRATTEFLALEDLN